MAREHDWSSERVRRGVSLVLLLCAVLSLSSTAHAAPILVDRNVDGSVGSRQVESWASWHPSAPSILFDRRTPHATPAGWVVTYHAYVRHLSRAAPVLADPVPSTGGSPGQFFVAGWLPGSDDVVYHTSDPTLGGVAAGTLMVADLDAHVQTPLVRWPDGTPVSGARCAVTSPDGAWTIFAADGSGHAPPSLRDSPAYLFERSTGALRELATRACDVRWDPTSTRAIVGFMDGVVVEAATGTVTPIAGQPRADGRPSTPGTSGAATAVASSSGPWPRTCCRPGRASSASGTT